MTCSRVTVLRFRYPDVAKIPETALDHERMSDEQFEQAADFFDAAVGAGARAVEPQLHRE